MTFTESDDRIAADRVAITDRAGRWATFQVGFHGRSVSEVADDLGCDWHAVMDAVVHRTPLIEDPDRVGDVTAVGLDEMLFRRSGPDFEVLYGRRNDAESINRNLYDTLWLRRAHSVGNRRQLLNMVTYALGVNALSMHVRRQGLAPPQVA